MDKRYLTPSEIVGAAVVTGRDKAVRGFWPLLVLGILGGAYIALAAYGSTISSFNLLADLTTYGLGKFVSGIVFTTGLIMVILSGAELFTGNVLICVSVFEKKTSLMSMLRNWVIIYFANLIGAVVIAVMISASGLWGSGEGALGVATIKIALAKVNLDFTAAFVLGILCNWLVCLGVWFSYAADTVVSKVAGIFFPVMLFVLSGYEHCVANMYYIPAGILAKAEYGAQGGFSDVALNSLNWGTFMSSNLIPVTLGNIVGGAVMVGMAYWFSLYRKKNN